jgi:hypothetical protein
MQLRDDDSRRVKFNATIRSFRDPFDGRAQKDDLEHDSISFSECGAAVQCYAAEKMC